MWTSGDGTPTPLTRHLLQAARLRHQLRVFGEGQAARLRRAELRLITDDLAARDAPLGDPGDGERLVARLDQARAAALVLSGRLSEMRHGVDIIDDNMRLVLSLAAGGLSTARSATTENWLAGFRLRLDDEVAALEAAAGPAGRLLAARPAAASRGLAPSGRLPAAQGTESTRGPWVVIFTALPEEYAAVRECLADPIVQRPVRGTIYEVGTLGGATGGWRVAIAETGPGSATAGAESSKAAAIFSPRSRCSWASPAGARM